MPPNGRTRRSLNFPPRIVDALLRCGSVRRPNTGFRATRTQPMVRAGRGSKIRLRRLRVRDHSTIWFWHYAIVLLLLFGAVPWLITHLPEPHHGHE